MMAVLAYNFAIHAMPFMVGLTAFQQVYALGAGFILSGIAALAVAFVSFMLVAIVVTSTKTPAFRFAALAAYTVPAVIAGYALVYGVTKNSFDSVIGLHLLCATGGLFIGAAALVNLSTLLTAPLEEAGNR